MDQSFYIPRTNYAPGNPWGSAAAAYGSDLDRLQAQRQQGYQIQAQGPLSIYDRFMQGYQQAKQQQMQEAQFQSDQTYRQAQIGHMNAQTGQITAAADAAGEQARQQAAYDAAWAASTDEKGNTDPGKLAANLSKIGQGSWIPKAQKEILSNNETKAKTLKEQMDSAKAARQHLASLAGTGLQSDADPSMAVRDIRALVASNPDLYGPHASVLNMIDPTNPDAQRLALKAIYGQGIEAKDLAPQTKIETVGGKVQAFNIGNPLLGGIKEGQTLGVNAQSPVGKAKADIANGLVDEATGNALIRKETTIQPNMATVMLQQGGQQGRKPGETLADPGEEALAAAIARKEQPPLTPGIRTPGANRINARAAELAAGNLPGSASVAEQRGGMAAFGPQGQQGKTLISLDTATGHLSQLDKAISGLGNGDVKALNRFTNWYKTDFGGSADVTNFEAVKSVAIPEVLKVAKGAGVINEAEEKRLNDIASRSANPQALRGFVTEYKKIMGSRVNALQPQYERYFPGQSVLDRITPESAAVYRSLGYGGKASPAPVNGDRVTVRSKTGQVGTIPRTQLGQAKLEGYTEVQ